MGSIFLDTLLLGSVTICNVHHVSSVLDLLTVVDTISEHLLNVTWVK